MTDGLKTPWNCVAFPLEYRIAALMEIWTSPLDGRDDQSQGGAGIARQEGACMRSGTRIGVNLYTFGGDPCPPLIITSGARSAERVFCGLRENLSMRGPTRPDPTPSRF